MGTPRGHPLFDTFVGGVYRGTSWFTDASEPCFKGLTGNPKIERAVGDTARPLGVGTRSSQKSAQFVSSWERA